MLFLKNFNLTHLIQYISLDGFTSLPLLMIPKDWMAVGLEQCLWESSDTMF